MKITTFCPILFLLLPLGASAQQDTLWEEEADNTTPYYYADEPEESHSYERPPYHPPPLEPMAARKVEKGKWDKASEGLDYSKDVPNPPKEQRQRSPIDGPGPVDWTSATQFWGDFFQVLAVIAAIAAIAFGVWRMLQTPRNRAIARDGVEITLANLDEYLHETDLERFLREALAQGNFPLAVRLYYLQVIKDLSAKKAIRWSREKTNHDYLREMRGHRLAKQFREATRTYERVWYGNQSLSTQDYARLEPQFKSLLSAI